MHKWVVISRNSRRKEIPTFDTFNLAANWAEEQYGHERVLIEFVGEEGEVVTSGPFKMRTPTIAELDAMLRDRLERGLVEVFREVAIELGVNHSSAEVEKAVLAVVRRKQFAHGG